MLIISGRANNIIIARSGGRCWILERLFEFGHAHSCNMPTLLLSIFYIC